MNIMDIEEKAVRINDAADGIVSLFANKFEDVGTSDKERVAMIAASIMLVIKDIDVLTNNTFSKTIALMIEETERLDKIKKMN
jgi:hypothetical protein